MALKSSMAKLLKVNANFVYLMVVNLYLVVFLCLADFDRISRNLCHRNNFADEWCLDDGRSCDRKNAEWASEGINVNVVLLTFVRTEPVIAMLSHLEFYVALTELIPLARIDEPDKVMQSVLYFVSNASNFVTGRYSIWIVGLRRHNNLVCNILLNDKFASHW